MTDNTAYLAILSVEALRAGARMDLDPEAKPSPMGPDYVKQAYTKMAYFALRPELYYDQLGGDHEPIHLTRRQRFRRWRRDLPRPYFKFHFGRPSNSYRWDSWDD